MQRYIVSMIYRCITSTRPLKNWVFWTLYKASHAIWDYTVLPATRHRWTHPWLNLSQTDRYLLDYLGGMEGWVDLGVSYIPRQFTCPQTVTHKSSNHLTATRLRIKPTTFWSQVRRPSCNATDTDPGFRHPGTYPKKPGGFFGVHPPKKPTPKTPTSILT